MLKKCYPGGKKKAFSVTYDDGVLQDIRFVGLLEKYGLRGTFNLNAGLMQEEFEWTHESGMKVRRLPESAARTLYAGHEVASHTFSHPYLEGMPKEAIMREMADDRKALSELFGREIPGFAVPFDYYSDQIRECAAACGFEYARISEESGNYTPGTDYFGWKAGIFHLSPNFAAYVDGFFETDEELAVCQIVGHTYDLDAEGMWEQMEDIFRRVKEDPDVLPMTTIQLIRYLKAMNGLKRTEGGAVNLSGMELWLRDGERIVCLRPGEAV